jgi:parallel beta-helix repeat protein
MYNYNGILLQDGSKYNDIIWNTANSNGANGIDLAYSNYNNIIGNTANSNGANGIDLANSWYTNITGNTANSNGVNGIDLYYSSYNNITENTANSNGAVGINLDYSSNYNNISCNWIHNNEYGFYLYDLHYWPNTGNTIESNNIIANSLYNFYNNQTTDVDARNNYWFATTNETIAASIFDYADDTSKGNVTFYPFETKPAPCAPVPELPTVLLLCIGLLALAGYVRLGKKKK